MVSFSKIFPALGSTRIKLIATFLLFSFLTGGVPLLVGGGVLYNTFLREAKIRVTQDLNAARQIYEDHAEKMALALRVAAKGTTFSRIFEDSGAEGLGRALRSIAESGPFDLVGLADASGRIWALSSGLPQSLRAAEKILPSVEKALKFHQPVRGTMVLPLSELALMDPALSERARLPLKPIPAEASSHRFLDEAMTLTAAVPLDGAATAPAALFGIKVLNGASALVDGIRESLFRGTEHDGWNLGTVTLFLGDVRIATNVLEENGQRALGTKVSPAVARQVLEQGKRWNDRAFVVNDWYITCYEPITDLDGRPVGMLYVGVLEKPYAGVRNKAILLFAALSVMGMSVAIGLGYFLEWKIIAPISRLSDAAAEVSKGNLHPDLGPLEKGEIGVVQRAFGSMLKAIRDRETRQKLETESKLVMAQKLSSIGRLAAGVAHEVNNPLTGVLTCGHLLLQRDDLDDEAREMLTVIVDATERVRRIVKSLLDFSRQTSLSMEPTDINRVVLDTLPLVENQAAIKGVALRFEPGEGIPPVSMDVQQVKSVLLNLLINALDATDVGGSITVSSRVALSMSREGVKRLGVELSVKDTGCGVPPENLEKIFEPFFSTKEVGKGTGLGLAVAYGIVARHGGVIRVQSQVGKGTEFTIWLPLEEHEAAR